MERVTTLALLARSVDFGEADRICELLTRDLGRVSAVARGARRSRRRFGGALSLFVVGEATLGRPRGDLLPLLAFSARQDLGPPIASDLVKLAHGSYLLEVTRELWPRDQPEPVLFDLLRRALATLAGSPPEPLLLRAFELQLLQHLGLSPSLDRCARCGREEPQGPFRFDPAQGGLVCPGCPGPDLPLSDDARRALLRLREVPLEWAREESVPAEARRQMRQAMLAQFHHHLGKELKSVAFLRQL